MARSLKKGPYVDEKFQKKIEKMHGKQDIKPVKTWARASMITPEMIGLTFLVHSGKDYTEVKISEEMVGHRLGEFASTTKFSRHGGRMERELEAREKEIGNKKKE